MVATKVTPGTQPIPHGWQRVRLGDVAEFQQGGTPPKANAAYWDGYVPFVTGADLGQRRIGRKSARSFLTEGGLKSGSTVVCNAGDLLLATRTRVGLVGIASEMLGASQDITLVEPKDAADCSFLYRVLDSRADELLRKSRGTTIQGVTREDVQGLYILLPPLPEQRAIAAVLDSIDDAIEGAEAVIAATEGLRDALLLDLLTRGLPGQHTEFRDVPGLGTIPADWDVVQLGDVLESTTYGTNSPLSADGAIPVLRMNNLRNGQIDLSDVRRANLVDKETRELNLIPGDILFNRTNSLALVGKVAVVRSLPSPISFASYLVRLRVQRGRANPFWLSALLWSDNCQSRIHKFATPSVSQANINPTNLKSLTIPLPSLAEQQAIAAALDGVDVAVGVARIEATKLRLLKESTVDALLTGRMRMEPTRL